MLTLAQTSDYWTSYRASKTYRLTIHLFNAQLNVGGVSIHSIDPYVVVFLTRDRNGSKKKTSIAKKTINPVWNQSLVFEDIDYQEEFRMEVKANNSMGKNLLLGVYQFVVRDIMTQSLQDIQTSLTLESEKFGGELMVSFDFDPPVLADAIPPSINVAAEKKGGVAERFIRSSAILQLQDPAYISVDENFACLLIDSEINPLEIK